MKFDPWSDCIVSRSPTNVKKMMGALKIVCVLIFLNGIASGKRVELQMIINENAFPVLIFVKVPTQSISTRLKGSLSLGK